MVMKNGKKLMFSVQISSNIYKFPIQCQSYCTISEIPLDGISLSIALLGLSIAGLLMLKQRRKRNY
jgi:hypothetical protein